jgi:nucleotidyltransferase substrate binding protein (TIGR01987 family)
MDRIKERIDIARKALLTLIELVDKPEVSTIERDAAIQRFEYTFEAIWKAAQLYLREQEGLESGSPKGVIRASWQTGLLDETSARQALAMADDRNLTVHTYNESLAKVLFSRLSLYTPVMLKWIEEISRRI